MNLLSLSLLILLLLPLQALSQSSPCAGDTAFHIVVLGSSTAAGAGANPADSSWVNRYRTFLQNLHPDYQLTNRAQGGFTTYRIMPSGFQPPANRPQPDTTRNITYALGLQPDAIIVNLPSNDVSSGYSVAEQLANFDTIVAHAQQANIPIWICTTQPKNYGGNPVPIQKQMEVRDSILVKYAPLTIDFWTGLADSTNQINSQYDSGDGTHLNNSGHFLLFQRAVSADLPGFLYQSPGYVDYVAGKLIAPAEILCGDSLLSFDFLVYNRGLADSLDATLRLFLTHLQNQQQIVLQDTLWGGLSTCVGDTQTWWLNVQQAGVYELLAVVSANQDSFSSNDSLRQILEFPGYPSLSGVPDTACGESSLQLQVEAVSGDSVRWFDAAMGGSFLGGGTVFSTPWLSSSTTYFAEAVRGSFFYQNELSTTQISNINWNGAMFDLVADTSLVIDSLSLKIADAGSQVVEVYSRNGTHLGHETIPADWSFWGSFPVTVNAAGDFVRIPAGPLNLALGDTLGIYLQLQDPSVRLSYHSLSQPIARSTDELTVITGSGSSHDFGGNYYPRDWNGTVYYHFGYKPDGDCVSERIAVEAMVSQPEVYLGPDTILDIHDSLLLNAGPGFLSYHWSDGSKDSQLFLQGSELGTGIYPIYLEAIDSLGCEARDTVIVVFAPLLSLEMERSSFLQIWPNPAQEEVSVSLPAGRWELSLVDMRGREVLNRTTVLSDGLNSVKLPLGMVEVGQYFMRAASAEETKWGRIWVWR